MRFLCTRFLCTIVFASIYLPTVHPRELTPRNPPIRKEPDQDPAAVHSNDYPLTDESSSEKNPKLLCTSSPFRFCIPCLGLHRAKIPKKPLFVCDDERKNKIMKFLNARPERYFTPENEVTLRVCLSEGFNDSTVDALMLSSAQATLRTLRKVSGVADAVEGMTRSELDGAIKQLWESIKGNESLLDDFVIMPNEHAIRYVVGAREAIGLLLASQGMSILFERTDSDKTQRLLEPLSKLLERPMFKLHSIAQWYTTQLPSGNLWLPDPLYRPKNSKGLKFLVGEPLATHLLVQFAPMLQTHLLREFPLELNRRWSTLSWYNLFAKAALMYESYGLYPKNGESNEEAVFRILSNHIENYDSPYDIVSLSNEDKLAAALGSVERARILLNKRARLALEQLKTISGDACTSSCPLFKKMIILNLDEHHDLITLSQNIVAQLHQFPEVLVNEAIGPLSFLIGSLHAAVISKDGLQTTKIFRSETERDEEGKKKVIETLSTYEALRPSSDRVASVISGTIAAELERVRLDEEITFKILS